VRSTRLDNGSAGLLGLLRCGAKAPILHLLRHADRAVGKVQQHVPSFDADNSSLTGSSNPINRLQLTMSARAIATSFHPPNLLTGSGSFAEDMTFRVAAPRVSIASRATRHQWNPQAVRPMAAPRGLNRTGSSPP
jgi:hypothetical protein